MLCTMSVCACIRVLCSSRLQLCLVLAMLWEDAKSIKRVNNRVKLLYREWSRDFMMQPLVFFVFDFYTIDVGLAWLSLTWFSSIRLSARHGTMQLQHTPTKHKYCNRASRLAITWSLLWIKMNEKNSFHFPLAIFFVLARSPVCYY